MTIGPGFDLAGLAGNGRIAVGDVRAVPAGLYAKAALEKLGIWPAVEPKLAMAENVRAALVLVARQEAPLGIVYATDAKVEPSVKIIGVFPEDSHPPIIYPAAATTNAKPGAARYLAFLRTQAAKTIFEKVRLYRAGQAGLVTTVVWRNRAAAPPRPVGERVGVRGLRPFRIIRSAKRWGPPHPSYFVAPLRRPSSPRGEGTRTRRCVSKARGAAGSRLLFSRLHCDRRRA